MMEHRRIDSPERFTQVGSLLEISASGSVSRFSHCFLCCIHSFESGAPYRTEGISGRETNTLVAESNSAGHLSL
jgi:hypothetical protein